MTTEKTISTGKCSRVIENDLPLPDRFMGSALIIPLSAEINGFPQSTGYYIDLPAEISGGGKA